MYGPDNAERVRIDNLLSFMLYELRFLGYHSRFVSYPYSFIIIIVYSHITCLFTINSAMNKVIRKSYRQIEILKIHGVKNKQIYVFTWAVMGAFSSLNIFFSICACILPTAEDMNLFISW